MKKVVGNRKVVTPLTFELPLYLEKWWHSLHYLLTGEIGPEAEPTAIVDWRRELGEDMGYGPARLHSPAEAKDFSHFLETQANLQARMSLEERGSPLPAIGQRWSSHRTQTSVAISCVFQVTCAGCPMEATVCCLLIWVI